MACVPQGETWLVGLVVKVFVLRAADHGFSSRFLFWDVSGASHPGPTAKESSFWNVLSERKVCAELRGFAFLILDG